ncbi:MAG: hypothetical protein E6J62_09815 [Deltaproteobacteria bacterium]|nr:MAG: hypothetical protein E6J62_09815 [Deltaproteobacteria bacterium]
MKTAHWLVPAVLSLSLGFAPAAHAQTASKTVPIAGIVSGQPESVVFGGAARIEVTEAVDNVSGSPPRMVVSITLLGMSGRGSSTGATYVLSGQTTLTRRLVANDVVEVTFPFSVLGSAAVAVTQTAVASFSFSYDATSNKIVSANASIAALNLPAAN